MTGSWRKPDPPQLTTLGVILLTIFGLLLLIALALVLSGCTVSYDGQTKQLRGTIACVNITGPGLSWTCPENLQAPKLPDSQIPTP